MKDLDEERDEYETRELYHIDLGNSDVWAMLCFSVLLSKLVSEHA